MSTNPAVEILSTSATSADPNTQENPATRFDPEVFWRLGLASYLEGQRDRQKAIDYAIYSLAAVQCWSHENPGAEVSAEDMLILEETRPDAVPQYIQDNRDVLFPIAAAMVDELLTWYAPISPATAN